MVNRKSILIGILLTVSIFLSGQSRQEREVLEVANAKFKWLVSKNIDSLKLVLDDRLTYIHSNGWVQSKKELIDDLLSGKLTYDKIDILESSIRLYPKSAVVTGRGRFVASLNGVTNTFELTYTETYVLQKREWKLVSRHASRAQ
jgi:hypothetical protein